MANNEARWPVSESEMGELIHAKDWSETSLGAIKEWPQALCSALKICLASDSPISICWGNDLFFFYNDAWKNLFEDKHPSALGQPAEEVFENSRFSFDSHFKQVFSSGEARELQDQQLSINSEEYYCNFSFIPIPDNGNSAGVFSILTAPTGGAQAEKKELHGAAHTLPTAIYTTDAEGYITYFNASAVEFFGNEPELGTGQWCVSWKLYYPNGAPMPHDECPMAVSLKEERSLTGKEAIAERPNGEYTWFSAYPSPLQNEEGEVISGINILVDISDQKESEPELRSTIEKIKQQKRLYKTIVSNTPDLVYVFDLNYRFTFANEALLQMWGRTREESLGKGLREVGYEPWHAEMHEREIDQVVNTKEPVQGEVSFPHDKLGKRFYNYIFVPVLDDENEVEAVAGITRDITDRKQVEQTLRKNEEKHRTLVENFPNGAVGLFNENLEYTAIGGELLNTFEIASEDRIGNKISDIYPDDLVEQVEQYFWAALDGEENSFEAEYHDRKLFAHTLPIEDEDGEIVSGMLVIQDITERWQAQQNLRESEAKFRMITENLNEVIWMMSADAEEFIHINPALEEIWGLARKELYENPLNFLETIHPDDRERVREKFVALPEIEFNEEFRIIQPDGEIRWVHSRATKVHDDKGKITRIIGIGEDITERKENELSNAYLSSIVQDSDDAIVSKDLEGTITSWNDSAERIFGYTADEVVGQPITIIIPNNRLNEEAEILDRVRRGDRVDHFETIRERKDGTLLDVSLTISPVRNSEGKIVGISKIARDITEQKQAEQELRKNRDRLRTTLEIDTVGVVFWRDDDFTVTKVNDAFLDMSGYTRDQILGTSWQELTPEEFYPVSKQAVADLKETGHTEPYEKQYIRKDGSRWWGLFAPRRINDHEVVEFVLDITDRKEAEEERERLLKKVETEKKRLSDVFKQAPSFMCILRGPDHVVERANDFYQKLVGDRELIGKPIAEAIPEIKGQGFIELLDEVYETGEPFRAQEKEIMLYRKPGEEAEKRFLDFVYQPFRDSDGSITGIFAQGVDLTERHHAKEDLKAINETLEERVEERTKKLRSYQKQLRSLASELNKAEEQERQRLASELHDKLGQMLTVAKMRVDGLQNHDLPEQVATDVEELKDIMDDVLDYNRDLMSELKPPPALDKEDVAEVLYWIANKMEKHGLDITVEDDDKPKPVEKEIRTIVHQSVRELLFNVVKHADVNAATLAMSRSGDQVKVIVEDKGRGFEPEEEESIPVEEGFGLFNIQERIEWYGGTFEIYSEPGKGTKATLYVPLKDKEKFDISELEDFEEPLPPSAKEEVQTELWQDIKVLLVDDHDMVRRGLRQMIEEQDDMTTIAEAADGQKAVELARETSPDVIVMDVNMPVLDGIEATQKIKAEMPNIRIIGLSLHDRKEVNQDMRSAGASDYLTKDEAFETLCATIRKEGATVK